MDKFGSLIADQIGYMQAYSLCEEILTVAMIAIAGMWAHILWIHRSIGKRVDQASQLLFRLLRSICAPERPKLGDDQ